MTNERTPSDWEVQLQSPDGKVMTEKVSAYWSPDYDGVKESVAIAGRCKAWLRNKKKIDFQIIGEAKLIKAAA